MSLSISTYNTDSADWTFSQDEYLSGLSDLFSCWIALLPTLQFQLFHRQCCWPSVNFLGRFQPPVALFHQGLLGFLMSFRFDHTLQHDILPSLSFFNNKCTNRFQSCWSLFTGLHITEVLSLSPPTPLKITSAYLTPLFLFYFVIQTVLNQFSNC